MWTKFFHQHFNLLVTALMARMAQMHHVLRACKFTQMTNAAKLCGWCHLATLTDHLTTFSYGRLYV